MMAFLFQATQYAKAPVEYGYYVVYGENADIAVRPGTDLAPNGDPLLQNSTTQTGFYTLSMGKWGPGYNVNYTDAMHIVNREAFNIKMIMANFTADSPGLSYVKIHCYNDTTNDGVGDTLVTVWNGTHSLLSTTNYIYLKAATTYGDDGGDSGVKIEIYIPELGVGLDAVTNEIQYNGKFMLWFTSTSF